jgi:ABC-2 type transport system ATP-binding protein
MPVVIATRHLSKNYRTGFWKNKELSALRNLNLEVQENEIFGYLGPNGAGKSTTLKLLMSLIHPTSGEAEILGRPVRETSLRSQIGYLPENPFFYEYLTAEEFLSYYTGLFGYSPAEVKKKVFHFLRLTDIYEARKLQLRKFSKGMLQRVGIAQALINDPKIVFLDEPMSGLDPIGRHQVRNLILQLKKAGKTVFFSTHILNDVETLCDRVAILDRGELVGCGSLIDLISQEVSHLELVVASIPLEKLQRFVPADATLTQGGSTVRIELKAETSLAPLISQIEASGGAVISLNPIRQSMEDYFFQLVANSKKPSPLS